MTRRSRSRPRNFAADSAKSRSLRCAIYTRVSTDQGLEQDFNSLDAQREACAAYIRSQAHEGWVLVPTPYDDGGYSGGNLDRPALKALLEAMAARRIDVIVVYKVDRLTRSLADFAKLVEAFDAAGVSFISITQSFNTTTSIGRLTLNMLLSFASSNARSQVSASATRLPPPRRRAFGSAAVPLGYRVVDRKLLIDETEAGTVRVIFRRYLELGSLEALIDDLKHKGVVTRIRTFATGRVVGGVPFTRGPLAYFLKNRMYLGEINHGANSYPGEHPPILDRDLFDAVQAELAVQATATGFRRSPSDALLTGRLFDHLGRPMTPSHAVKAGLRYRCYISRRGTGSSGADAASLVRVSAPDIEDAVLKALASTEDRIGTSKIVGPAAAGPTAVGRLTREPCAIQDLIDRVAIRSGSIEIRLIANAVGPDWLETIAVPWSKLPTRVHWDIIAPAEGNGQILAPCRQTPGPGLLSAVAASRRWFDDLVSGRVEHVEKLAVREGRSPRYVTMLLSLAFLAPNLVRAIVDNRMPRGIGVTQLMDLPCEWSQQRWALGLANSLAGRAFTSLNSATA